MPIEQRNGTVSAHLPDESPPLYHRRRFLIGSAAIGTAALLSMPLLASCSSEGRSSTPGVSIENGHFLINGIRKRFVGVDNYAAAVLPQAQNICEPTMNYSDRAQLLQNTRKMGANAIRIWNNSAIDDGGKAMEEVLHLAAPDIFVLPSLTNQWANCTGRQTLTDSWYINQEYLKDGFVDYLEWFTRKYKGNKQLLGIETVNEAQCSDPVALARFAQICYEGNGKRKGIKQIDPDRLVTIGTIGSGQPGTVQDTIKDVWRWCDFGQVHIYPNKEPIKQGGEGYWGDAYNGLVAQLRRASELKKPLLIGEIGDAPNTQETASFLKSKLLDLRRYPSFGGVLAWQLMLPQDLQNFNYDGLGFTQNSPMGQMLSSLAPQIINS